MFFSPSPNEPIRLSALGRDVSVGNLYDYYTNGIFTCNVPVPNQFKHVEIKINSKTECSFIFPHQPVKSKRYVLGLNSQVDKSIEQGLLDSDQLWLSNYLKTSQTGEEDVQVDVYIRVVRRVETLDSRFYESNKKKYQETSSGRTHLVEQVIYGAEFICRMRRTIDRSCETKETAEGSLYLSAKSYFDQVIGSNSAKIRPTADLDRVWCTLYSTVDLGNVADRPFRVVTDHMRKIINNENDATKWQPIEILLRYIPEQLDTRLWSDKLADHQMEKERSEETWNWIVDQSNRLSSHPSVDRIPPLAKILSKFRDGLAPLRKAIKNFAKSNTSEQAKMSISNLTSEVAEWLIHRRREMETILMLLKQSQLPMFNFEDIKTWAPSKDQSMAKVFSLKIGYIPDPLMEKIKHLTNNPDPAMKLPVFPVLSDGKERFGLIGRKLHKFSEEEQSHHLVTMPNTSYYIGLVPVSSPLDDGTITTIEYQLDPLQLPDDSPKKYTKVISHQELLPIEEERSRSGSFGYDHQRAYREVESLQPSGRGDFKDGRSDEEDSPISVSSITERIVKIRQKISNAEDEKSSTGSLLRNPGIAEKFTHTSRLIKDEIPKVFLLEAEEKVDGDFRWFDIGREDDTNRKHKVIVLMGTTGCGKSTLIDGMVNYILGVQWKDPFRFKCVREDESIARNQAHSQTNSVTAYTIHYQKSMAVPYSITIIDTPGYGDTTGIKRDKEITQQIRQFLTRQSIRVDEIHSACFVAASGDNRLSTTQNYIMDSVIDIFGQDFQKNLQLLVTFADNAEPPVVEACRAGNVLLSGFPYSKFNSSVLYDANTKEDEDIGFNELFWNMCQVNFFSFFLVLEEMKGRSLTLNMS